MLENIKNWLKSYVIDGILLIILGIFMVINGSETLDILFRVIGIVLIVLAIVHVISFIANKKGERLPQDMFSAVLMLGFGIWMTANPKFFTAASFAVFGAILLYGSIVMITNAIMLGKQGGTQFKLSLALGILTLILGIIIIINPTAFASAIVTIQGISLIIEGISMLIVMARMKKAIKPE